VIPRPPFDFRAPDYVAEFRWRLSVLARLRAEPATLAAFRAHYAQHPADFIDDWGVTFDPRNLNVRRPALVPFRLFPKQRELIGDIHRHWRDREPLLVEKSRDIGASWCVLAFAVSMCLFNRGMTIGFGSRKEEYVDKLGSPKSLFWKARRFLAALPAEFRGGWDEKRHGAHMRLTFPQTDATITGEAGDNIGRGDRTSLYVIDESAYLARPHLIEASLSATTDCRIDLSSVNGMANVFAEKRHSGRVKVFVFDWRDDPRKDDEWYEKQRSELDPLVIAQEIDRNYAASVDGVLIPAEWVTSAIDAHVKLGFQPSGERRAAFDVADQGKDKNAILGAHGVVIRTADSWFGRGSDIFESVAKAFAHCDANDYPAMLYDSDGLGAGVRGDARVLNKQRAADAQIEVEAWRGSGEVVDPDDPIPSLAESATPEDRRATSLRRNGDFFANAKAQGWWALRVRFMRTHRAVTEGAQYEPHELISLSSDLPDLTKLRAELSQVTARPTESGQQVVNKAPDGMASPNLADCAMMLFAPRPRRRRGFMTRQR
jgi:hypothetical protein